jgi:hypothetical protein
METSLIVIAHSPHDVCLCCAAGVRICRTLGTSGLKNLDPYLMLDELKCDSKSAAAGFPDHPHRGEPSFVHLQNHPLLYCAASVVSYGFATCTARCYVSVHCLATLYVKLPLL